MIIDHGDGDDYHSIRFLKDNIELERQQAIRDIMVKRDIARWLQVRLGILLEIESRHLYHQYISLDYHHNDQARLAEIEARHGVEAESREAVRRLTRRRSRLLNITINVVDNQNYDSDDVAMTLMEMTTIEMIFQERNSGYGE